jgi:hypothetical protein
VQTAEGWNCGHCGQPAEAKDIHYPSGEVEHGAYYVCVNKECPYYVQEIPNFR